MINIYQNATTEINFQLLDEQDIPKDLTAITSVLLDVGIKKNQSKILTQVGSIVSAINGQIKFLISPTPLNSLTPTSVNVPSNRNYKPTATLYGYVSLLTGATVVDKIFIDDMAIYFDMVIL